MIADYQRQNLFILIGTNPLPNYVAVRLLLREDGHVYLVHSNDVNDVADNLLKTLGMDQDTARYTKVPVDESDSYNIYTQVQKFAEGKTSLGLHYTGGTKSMSVHAYRALLDRDKSTSFSYLNARDLSLVIDRPELDPVSIPVALEVNVSIEDLLGLHGYYLRSEPSHEPDHFDFAQTLIQTNPEAFRAWCNQNLRNEKGNFRPKRDLETIDLNNLHALFADPAVWNPYKTLGDLNKAWGKRPNQIESYTAKWIDGKWLEDYVLGCINEISDDCQVRETCISIEPNKGSSSVIRDFEIDVIAMRGYQLFALSCSTGTGKSFLKHKLFEAYIRARQMGGDEAKVALVCRAPSKTAPSDANSELIKKHADNCPERIQMEIEEKWDVKGKKVVVFGEEHLADLKNHLTAWFKFQ